MDPISSPLARLPEPGDLLAGKYRLTSILGRGGMGVVFEGHHEMLDRVVAIKVLAPEVLGSTEAVTRFLNEARAAAKIHSEHVVHVLDVGLLDGGLPFMVMEKLQGNDLADVLKAGLPPVTLAVDLLVEAIEGVAHAHLEGIIHRDLKPSNLFLARRPDRSTVVKVLDFGISKLTRTSSVPSSGSVTSTNAILGSPLYMSPEQLRSSKSIDARADIWSLGVIAYELLSKTVPFDGDNLVEIFARIQEREPRPLTELRPEVPPALDEVVRRCLRREVSERYPSTFTLAHALAPFGTSRAQAALARIEAHVSSKGRSFDEVNPTLPLAVASDPRSMGSGSRGAATPPVVRSAPDASAAGVAVTRPSAGAPAPEAPKGATASPWSSTRRESQAPRVRRGVWIAAIASVVLVGGITTAVVTLRPRSSPAPASTTAPDLPEDPEPEPAPPASVTTPPPSVIVLAPPPASASADPRRAPTKAASPPAARPPAPAPKPAPSDSASSPLKMRPL